MANGIDECETYSHPLSELAHELQHMWGTQLLFLSPTLHPKCNNMLQASQPDMTLQLLNQSVHDMTYLITNNCDIWSYIDQ
jgi:hypothetical protein